MNNTKVVIIDYGVGNLLSVQRAVEECGSEVITSFEPSVIKKADRVILPGVGAFSNGMQALESRRLVPVIKSIASGGIPLLGICLGMQLLFDQSEEHGICKGLGIIPGRVISIPAYDISGASLKIPHIGWNSLIKAEGAAWDGTILNSVSPGNAVYFIHSFMAVPENPVMRIADCIYGGNRITAVIGNESVFGCQFHPEKSGDIGLGILKKFLRFE